MARFADLFLSSGFATGVAGYDDFYPGDEQNTHVVVNVLIAGHVVVQAIVDTGAPWCIFAPEVLRGVKREEYLSGVKLLIRGTRYVGKLVRMSIGLRADGGGKDLEVDATVFIPRLRPGEVWPYPNFIGLDGFLDRIRFAVDPHDNVFYFGPV